MKEKIAEQIEKAKNTLSKPFYEMFIKDVEEIEQRNRVFSEYVELSEDDLFDRKLSDVITFLSGLKEKYGDLNLIAYWDDFSGEVSYELEKARKETDLERDERIYDLVTEFLLHYMKLEIETRK